MEFSCVPLVLTVSRNSTIRFSHLRHAVLLLCPCAQCRLRIGQGPHRNQLHYGRSHRTTHNLQMPIGKEQNSLPNSEGEGHIGVGCHVFRLSISSDSFQFASIVPNVSAYP